MSLLDALLLEEPLKGPTSVPPSVVWLAIRADGLKGSGTENDPYDGSVRQGDAVASALPVKIPGVDPKKALVTVPGGVAIGFNEHDVVTISGVTSGNAAESWNGTYPIFDVQDDVITGTTTFCYYMQVEPTADAAGSAVLRKSFYPFDEVLAGLPENTAIRLGPGVFETRGRNSIFASWQPKAGQKLVGSGMGLTTLRLVYAPILDDLHHAIGSALSPHPDGFEARDFTVDCNLPGQLLLYGQQDSNVSSRDLPQVACGAIRVAGSHVRIRRVRAINYGTQCSQECFVFAVALAHPDDNPDPHDSVIEECVLEQPSRNNTHETTCLILGGGENANGETAYHRSCVIRNCYVNGEYLDNPVRIAGISYSGLTATVTTVVAHGRNTDDWVIVSGAQDNGALSKIYNGSFKITKIDATRFSYSLPGTGPSSTPVGEMWVGRWPSTRVGVGSGNLTQVAGRTWELVTASPHFRRPGDHVAVSGVKLLNPLLANPFNGSFIVETSGPPGELLPSPTKLRFTLHADPDPDNPIKWTGVGSSIVYTGTLQQAMTVDAGTTAVAHGNRIFNCGVGLYHDSHNTLDAVVRGNVFYRVQLGIFQNLEGFSPFHDGALSTVDNRNPKRVTTDHQRAVFRTTYKHSLLPGQGVRVQDVFTGSPPTDVNKYNGIFPVVSVSNDYEFTYLMDASETVDPNSGITPPQYSQKWQERQLTVANNVIAIGLHAHPDGHNSPRGIDLTPNPLGTTGNVYSYRHICIRNNSIRHAEQLKDPVTVDRPDLDPIGMSLVGCESLVLKDNTVDLNSTKLIQYVGCKNLSCFGNMTAAGGVIEAHNPETDARHNLVTTALDDALVLSFLRKGPR